jgi:Ca2+-binding RTX toxin-like protein
MAFITGNANSDWLVGTNTGDFLKGLGGNDFLKGGGGADVLSGGSGIDTAMYGDSSEGVLVDLLGTGRRGTAEGDTYAGVENVWGSAYEDTLKGDNGTNELSGFDGYDALFGRGGADVLDGGYGNDKLEGGAGGDVLNGGGSDEGDIASYRDSPEGVFVYLTTGFVSGGDATGDTLISIEGAHGSESGDTLFGDSGLNELKGYGGNDFLAGFGGFDLIFGGDGHDTLWGMDGDDLLLGGEGNDEIVGGAGMDEMAGDLGADRLVWTSITDTGVTVATGDIVYGFDRSEGDRLDLYEVDADVYAAGDQAFRFIGAAAFSGTPGEINYVYVDGDTIIQMQTGLDADVEGVIRIQGIVTPEASWFLL